MEALHVMSLRSSWAGEEVRCIDLLQSKYHVELFHEPQGRDDIQDLERHVLE